MKYALVVLPVTLALAGLAAPAAVSAQAAATFTPLATDGQPTLEAGTGATVTR